MTGQQLASLDDEAMEENVPPGALVYEDGVIDICLSGDVAETLTPLSGATPEETLAIAGWEGAPSRMVEDRVLRTFSPSVVETPDGLAEEWDIWPLGS